MAKNRLKSRSQPKIWRKIQKIGGDNITSITRFFHVWLPEPDTVDVHVDVLPESDTVDASSRKQKRKRREVFAI